MAITLSTGTQVAIASTYGAVFAMSAITNAAEAVATLAASHGCVVGDYLEVTSGWELLTNRIVRVKTVATNDVTFEGINTASTSNYPAGTGIGSIRRITAWTPITQIQGVDPSGGDLDFADTTTIVDRIKKQVPTTRTPIQIDFTFFDDPALAWYPVALAASESAVPIGMRMFFPDGSKLLSNCYCSLQTTPNVASNAPLTAKLGFSAVSTNTRYKP
jgi:hypothetical protein